MVPRKALGGVLALSLVIAGCDRSPAERADPAKVRGEPDAVYVTRGRIERLPGDDAGPREILIQHEPVPEFTNAEGIVVGMNVMIMPFPVSPGVSVEGMAVGDPVEFEWAVWWTSAARGWEIRAITALPKDTPLNLGSPGQAKPSGDAGP